MSVSGQDDLEADIVDRDVCEWCDRSFLHGNPCLKRREKFPLLQRRAPRSRECVLCDAFRTYCVKGGAPRTSTYIRANPAQYREDLFKWEEEKLTKGSASKSRGLKRPRRSKHGAAPERGEVTENFPPLAAEIAVVENAAIVPAVLEQAAVIGDAAEMLALDHFVDAFSSGDVVCREKMNLLLARATPDVRALWQPLLEPWLVTEGRLFVQTCSWIRSGQFRYPLLKKRPTFMDMWAKCEENKVLRLSDDALTRRLLALKFPPPMPKHAANRDGTLSIINPDAGAWTHYLEQLAFIHCVASSRILTQFGDVLCQHEAKRSEAVCAIVSTATLHMDNLFGELLRVHFANIDPSPDLAANVGFASGTANVAPEDAVSTAAATDALCVFRRLIPSNESLGVNVFNPTKAETAHGDRIFGECESCVSMLEILAAASAVQTRSWTRNKDLLVMAARADDVCASFTTICGASFERASTMIKFRFDIRSSLASRMERDICAALAPHREQIGDLMGNSVHRWSPELAIREHSLREMAENVRVHGCGLVRSVSRAHAGVDADDGHGLDLQQAALSLKRSTSGRDVESLICEVACAEVLLLFGGLCDFAVGMERSGDNPAALGIILDSTTVLNEQVYFQRAAPVVMLLFLIGRLGYGQAVDSHGSAIYAFNIAIMCFFHNFGIASIVRRPRSGLTVEIYKHIVGNVCGASGKIVKSCFPNGYKVMLPQRCTSMLSHMVVMCLSRR
jgi:hypothetical protein